MPTNNVTVSGSVQVITNEDGTVEVITAGAQGPPGPPGPAASDHATLTHLSYATANHTGFAGTGVANTFTETQTMAGGFSGEWDGVPDLVGVARTGTPNQAQTGGTISLTSGSGSDATVPDENASDGGSINIVTGKGGDADQGGSGIGGDGGNCTITVGARGEGGTPGVEGTIALATANSGNVLTVNSGVVAITGTLNVSGDVAAANLEGIEIRIGDPGNGGYETIVAVDGEMYFSQSSPGSGNAKLNAQRLTLTGSLSAASATISGSVSAGTLSGSGGSITNLNASNLASGTVSDARLSANVPLKNAANVFTQNQTINGNVVVRDTISLGGTSGHPGQVFVDNQIGIPTVTVDGDTGTISANAYVGGEFTGGGASLTNLNATNLASGTVADARLSANVALLNAANTFVSGQVVAGTIVAGNTGNAGAIGVKNSSNTTVASIGSTGTVNGTSFTGGPVVVTGASILTATNNSTKPLIIKGAASMATNYFEIQDSGNTTVARLDKDGNWTAQGYSGPGTSLTNLNATNLSSGTVADARLSANVPLLNATNTFSVGQTVTGTMTATLFSGSGASLTSLNGTNVSSGTVADARLSANVPLLNAGNTFSVGQTVTGTMTATLFSGSGASLTSLNGTNVSSGTVADARLSSNIPLKNAANTFAGNDQTITGGDLLLDNAHAVQAKNSAGTYQRVFFLDGANNYGARNEGTAGNSFYGNSNGTNAGRVVFQTAGNQRANISAAGCLDVGFNLQSDDAQLVVQSANFTTRITHINRAVASQTADLQQWQKSDNTVWATVSENGYTTTRKTSAPADAELSSSEAAYWLDDTNGAAKFMIKAKSANGTVVTGSITLT